MGGGLEERIYHRGRMRVGFGMLRPNHLQRTGWGKCESAGNREPNGVVRREVFLEEKK